MNTVDLSRDDAFADGPPHELFRQLRDESPVHWNASAEGRGFWSVTRYDDIAHAVRDWETFSSQRSGITIQEGGVFPPEMQQLAFVMMDPPAHTKHRGILQKVFTPKVVREQEPEIRKAMNGLVDGIVEAGACDFVEDIAVDFPLLVVADLLGVPHEDRRKLFAWTNTFADTSVTPEQGTAVLMEIATYVMALVADRRASPRDDLVSALIAAEIDGEQLNDLEVTAHFAQLMAAANETTRNAMAGGMLALIDHPDQRAKLIDNPALIGSAVEEILRWHTPMMYEGRTATRDVEIAGQPVREGDFVVLWNVSGNRDERAFPAPDVFDVARNDEKHLSFSAGRHFCLGNQLARLELRVAFDVLLERLPSLELGGPLVRQPSNIFHWIKAMPVSYPIA
jgi:cytochrome P450